MIRRLAHFNDAPLFSSALLITIAIAIFCLASWFLGSLLGASIRTRAAFAPHELLLADVASQLRPEPAEQWGYLLFVIACPGLVWLGTTLRSRLAPSDQIFDRGRCDTAFLIATILAGLFIFAASAEFLHMFTPTSVVSISAVLLAGVLIAAADAALGATSRAHKIVLFGLTSLVIILPFAWKVFDLQSVHDGRLSIGHLEAFLYSVVRVHGGGTCLLEVVPQYGCYAELLSPAFAAIGLNVLNVTLVAAALQVIPAMSVLYFCARVLRSPTIFAAAGICLIIMENRVFYQVADPFLQYMPLRFFFPGVSLLAVLSWQASAGIGKAAFLGVFSAVAIAANLDSGLITFLSLGLFILMSGPLPVKSRWPLRARLTQIFTFVTATILSIGLAVLLLSAKAGAWIDPHLYTLYQRIFVDSGFMMLPLPAPPHVWTVLITAGVVTLTIYGLARSGHEVRPEQERSAYLAILGIGLLSYYVGRSHWHVLMLAGWPLVITTFYLLDIAVTRNGRRNALSVTALTVSAWFALFGLVGLVNAWPLFREVAVDRWFGILTPQPSRMAEDVDFVRSLTVRAEPVGVIAIAQAVILAEADRRQPLTGPGLWELLLRRDAEKLVAEIVERGPEHLFVELALVEQQKEAFGTEPWLRSRLPSILAVYSASALGPGGRLLYLRRHSGDR